MLTAHLTNPIEIKHPDGKVTVVFPKGTQLKATILDKVKEVDDYWETCEFSYHIELELKSDPCSVIIRKWLREDQIKFLNPTKVLIGTNRYNRGYGTF